MGRREGGREDVRWVTVWWVKAEGRGDGVVEGGGGKEPRYYFVKRKEKDAHHSACVRA